MTRQENYQVLCCHILPDLNVFGFAILTNLIKRANPPNPFNPFVTAN